MRILFALLLVVVAGVVGMSDVDRRKAQLKFIEKTAAEPDVISLPSGLMYKILRSGPAGGKSPNATSPCEVQYRGTLMNGVEFDSSFDRSTPSVFVPSQVVRGWREALLMMKEGDQWWLVIPAKLGYGESGKGKTIPPGSLLLFELTLVRVLPERKSVLAELFSEDGSFQQPSPAVLVGVALVIVAISAKIFYDNCTKAGRASSGNYGRKVVEPVITLSKASRPSDPHVWMDIVAGERFLGRIEIQLFASVVPRSAENFRSLCTGEKGKSTKSGRKLHYKGCRFHRVMPKFALQGGDIHKEDGTGDVESIYPPREAGEGAVGGGMLEDEFTNGTILHTCRGLVSWANQRGEPNSNGSQFFITFAKKATWMDGENVVFGRVVKGLPILDFVEHLADAKGVPAVRLFIGDCGEVKKTVIGAGIVQKGQGESKVAEKEE